MTAHIALVPMALAFASALFAWFYALVREGRQMTIVAFIVGLIVIETALYETITVPVGIFHLSSGSFQVRTIDIIIVIALLANALGSRSHQGLTFTALAWITFSTWLVTEGFVGVLNGNSRTFIGYEIKAVLYIGLFSLASRASLRDARTRLALERLLYFSATLSALTVTLGAVGKKINIDLPGLRGAQFGNVGSIGATLFVALGILALAIAICSERQRFPLLLAVAPLFVPPLMAHQRASLLNLAVSISALLVFLPIARHRLRATFVEVALVALAAAALVALPVMIAGVVESKRVIPFSSSLSTAISGGEKKLSAQDRVNQLAEARKLIKQRPVAGWGLGQTITYYEVGFKAFFTTYLTHNIIADLLLRCGAIGLMLFLLAVGLSLSQAIQTWRHAGDPMIAAVALGSVAIVFGWLAHGMVESLFEHVQLAPFFGIMIGLAQAAALERGGAEAAEERTLVGIPAGVSHGF